MKKSNLIWRIAELESNLKTQSNTIKNQQKAMDKLKAMLNAANLQIDLLDNHCRSLERKYETNN